MQGTPPRRHCGQYGKEARRWDCGGVRKAFQGKTRLFGGGGVMNQRPIVEEQFKYRMDVQKRKDAAEN